MAKNKVPEKETFQISDRLPDQERLARKAGELMETIANFYGFEGIATSFIESPRFWHAALKSGCFEENLPAACKTPDGSEILLRPSGALGILRAYVTHKMNDLPHPVKLLFGGESFFATSKGAHASIKSAPEWGLVMIGEEGPIAEAEIMQIFWKSFEKMGIQTEGLSIRVNATSCGECRSSFRAPFAGYFRSKANRLCKHCKRHLKTNPTRILACREEPCKILAQNAPQVLDYLCELCKKHLRGVLEFLDEMKIPYALDSKFFKDGTTFGSLIFEIVYSPPSGEHQEENTPVNPALDHEALHPVVRTNAATTTTTWQDRGTFKGGVNPERGEYVLVRGGRMSRIGELVAGRRLDVACGITRIEALVKLIAKKGGDAFELEKPKVFLAQLGELAKRKSLGLLETLRGGGISVQESLGRDSMKSQLKTAENVGVQMALILGQKEALDRTIIVREIQSGIQETVPQDKLIEFLKRKLKK